MTPHRPKFGEKFFFFFSGAVMSTPFPAMINSLISYFFIFSYSRSISTLLSIVIIAPLLEEFAKIYTLFYRHGETEKSLTTLGFWTGLGFGFAEFLLYVYVLKVSIFIRLPLILLHASNTTIAAYGVSRNRGFAFYIVAVLLHALNNYFSLAENETGVIIVIIIAYLAAFILYKRATERTIDHTI